MLDVQLRGEIVTERPHAVALGGMMSGRDIVQAEFARACTVGSEISPLRNASTPSAAACSI